MEVFVTEHKAAEFNLKGNLHITRNVAGFV